MYNGHVMKEIKRGMKNGIPIALGYLSVSFSFGAIAVSMGFSVIQAVLISLLNLTSAGQFASLGIIAGQGTYLEMAIVELTVNIRYAFMSLSLSQKVDEKFKGIYKWLLSFFITDEIFAVAIQNPGKIRRKCESYLLLWACFDFYGRMDAWNNLRGNAWLYCTYGH